MTYKGTLKSVADVTAKSGKHYWRVKIDTDDKGEVEFHLWDTAFVGQPDKDGNHAVCDVHGLEGERVIFEAAAGKVRDEKTGERWPATLTAIMPEADAAPKPIKPEGGERDHALAEHLKAARIHLMAAEELVR